MAGGDIPRYAVTTDVVIFTVREQQLQLLLIQRANEPHRGRWALPGGFVDPDEDLEASARRELEEETGVRDLYLEQLHAFGAPGRDPRGRTITIAYYALAPADRLRPQAADDAAATDWFAVEHLPELAFDHADIVRMAYDRLRQRLRDPAVVLQLLPEPFTLSEAQRAHERIAGRRSDPQAFAADILGSGRVEWIEQDREGERLYRLLPWDRAAVAR